MSCWFFLPCQAWYLKHSEHQPASLVDSQIFQVGGEKMTGTALDVHALILDAQEATGLDDFGDYDFGAPLSC
jgi:hypothetical protein